eukprot:scaffold23750_cov73-Isochrysis_galbana.AAC.1
MPPLFCNPGSVLGQRGCYCGFSLVRFRVGFWVYVGSSLSLFWDFPPSRATPRALPPHTHPLPHPT